MRQMLHDEMIRRKARGQFIFQSELELDTAIEGWLREWLKDANKRVAGAKSLNPKDVASVRADFAKCPSVEFLNSCESVSVILRVVA